LYFTNSVYQFWYESILCTKHKVLPTRKSSRAHLPSKSQRITTPVRPLIVTILLLHWLVHKFQQVFASFFTDQIIFCFVNVHLNFLPSYDASLYWRPIIVLTGRGGGIIIRPVRFMPPLPRSITMLLWWLLFFFATTFLMAVVFFPSAFRPAFLFLVFLWSFAVAVPWVGLTAAGRRRARSRSSATFMMISISRMARSAITMMHIGSWSGRRRRTFSSPFVFPLSWFRGSRSDRTFPLTLRFVLFGLCHGSLVRRGWYGQCLLWEGWCVSGRRM